MGRQYILDAIDAALCAGADILSIYNDPASDFQIEKKADNSPLTIADRKAHETIAGYLKNTPYPLLSEVRKAFILCREKYVGHSMDCGSFGRNEGVHKTEWRIYC